MSSITTIRIKHKLGFMDKESLAKALMAHGLGEGVSIVEVAGKFQLSVSKRVQDAARIKVETQLHEDLERIVHQILPTYTRLLAIKDFQAQNFRFVRETMSNGGELLIFERASTLVEGGEFEILKVTIRSDNTLTIDAENFMGKTCLDATGPFEQKIGRVIKREMKSEALTPIRERTSITQKNKTRRIQRKQLRI